ncbi:hypothetical protein [Sandaracinus amylolyticus]|uniref:hypothetical protein n=1 Tax=Sandaracinus amylolyticus TaxID=927083 RepID=UPI00069CE90E|nr:hypothetical protein [Sandaracinus amylolyticus]
MKDVIRTVRVVVRAHHFLRRAYADEASERVKKARQLELRRALDRLTDAMVAFEHELVRLRATPTVQRPGFDWAGFFRTSLEILDVVKTAMSEDRAAPRAPVDFIDAEVVSDDG